MSHGQLSCIIKKSPNLHDGRFAYFFTDPRLWYRTPIGRDSYIPSCMYQMAPRVNVMLGYETRKKNYNFDFPWLVFV